LPSENIKFLLATICLSHISGGKGGFVKCPPFILFLLKILPDKTTNLAGEMSND